LRSSIYPIKLFTGYIEFISLSYKKAQEIFKKRHGITAKTSWIAHIKSDHKKTSGPAKSRTGDYKYPCPQKHRRDLEKVLKELKMI